MYDAQKHTEVEGFIIKWTLVTTYTGVTVIFVTKILFLLRDYIGSGKLATDLVTHIWEAVKALI